MTQYKHGKIIPETVDKGRICSADGKLNLLRVINFGVILSKAKLC